MSMVYGKDDAMLIFRCFFEYFIDQCSSALKSVITVMFLLSILTLYFFLFHKKLKKIGEERLHAKNLLIKWILQSLNSLKDIKISKKEDKVLQKFTSKVDIFENSRRKINIWQGKKRNVLKCNPDFCLFSDF